MRVIGNIIWMLCGGIFTALYWFGAGCLLYHLIIAVVRSLILTKTTLAARTFGDARRAS